MLLIMDVLVLFTVSITLNRIHRLAKSCLPYWNRGFLIGLYYVDVRYV